MNRKSYSLKNIIWMFLGTCVVLLILLNIFPLEKVNAQVTLTPDGYRYPPTALIAAAQDLTGAWVDLGGEIKTDRYNYFTLWIELDINNSLNVRIRILAKTVNGGALEYTMPIKTIGSSDVKLEGEYFEFNVDADQNMIIGILLDNTIPWAQVQVMAGTVGGTAGQIDSAYYSMGK